MQKPSIGRIVHYDYNGSIIPAIITKVFSDTVVNLRAFEDSTGSPLWFTSVKILEGETSSLGLWFWPPFVPPAAK